MAWLAWLAWPMAGNGGGVRGMTFRRCLPSALQPLTHACSRRYVRWAPTLASPTLRRAPSSRDGPSVARTLRVGAVGRHCSNAPHMGCCSQSLMEDAPREGGGRRSTGGDAKGDAQVEDGGERGNPQHFERIARALCDDGYVAVNFGVAERYPGADAVAIWDDALQECARLEVSGVMRSTDGSDSAERSVSARQAGVCAGGRYPVLHALRESLTNFVLGLRSALATGDHALVLTSYTDLRVCCLAPDQPSGGPRFDRDGPTSAVGGGSNGGRGVEKRVDPSDGCSYSKQEFVDFYGASAEQRWAAAKPPTGSEDKRKLSACLFLNRGWQEEKHGGSTTIFAFDESTEVGTFRATAARGRHAAPLPFGPHPVRCGEDRHSRCFAADRIHRPLRVTLNLGMSVRAASLLRVLHRPFHKRSGFTLCINVRKFVPWPYTCGDAERSKLVTDVQ